MVKLKGISRKTSMRNVSKIKDSNGFQVVLQYGYTHIKWCSFTCHQIRCMRWRSSHLVMDVKPSKAMLSSLELLNELKINAATFVQSMPLLRYCSLFLPH
ncbi:hypothetical protein AMTRI_Chr07g76460 [Amborella trichopoda]